MASKALDEDVFEDNDAAAKPTSETAPVIHQTLLISCMQKIVIYETKARFYVVGSNNTETRFRVIKLDRTEAKELHITDDKVEYTQREIRDLLLMIDVGNRPKTTQKGSTGLTRNVSAFGIVGFVRFLEGYYIILITKRRRVALIGPHTIYKIEDTAMVYIPNDTVKYSHPDEQRYVKMFQNVDLSSNFYFSYSYDLTHSLQYNMSVCRGLRSAPTSPDFGDNVKFWPPGVTKKKKIHRSQSRRSEVEDANQSIDDVIFGNGQYDLADSPPRARPVPTEKKKEDGTTEEVFGVKCEVTRKYVWNQYLLTDVKDVLHPDWLLHITHGFIGQSSINIYGRPIYLTVIARRSNLFAGTRFLKRGANFKGWVANEVESEQIVHDASVLSLDSGKFTSIVQLRGSIPFYWSQDLSNMMPKPPITLDQADPFGFIAGQHFNEVLKRYGAPVIILNLVKKREKRKHESILTENLVHVLEYLNQFLPKQHAIKYIGFDMARVSKNKNSNVLHRLAEIAEYCVKMTGFFQSGKKLYCNDVRPHPRCKDMQATEIDKGFKQRGVVRTNCVDCLDRTNTAQFAIGKCALAFQLHALGVIDSPVLEFDSDCVRMLEEMYEDQGDTLALQYGGSQLVHRIKGYRKIAPFTSSTRDIMNTLSRYYSNAFSDSEKQNALNLFLGVFEPREGEANIWELPTDFYLHNYVTQNPTNLVRRPYCQWWEGPVVASLPYAYEEEAKGSVGKTLILRTRPDDERVDGFWDYYRPYELTSLDEVYSFHVPNSIRDFMPKFSSSFSPFTVRVQPGRRQEESGVVSMTSLGSLLEHSLPSLLKARSPTTVRSVHNRGSGEHNPNVSGKDSTSSVLSTGSEEGSTSSSDVSDIDGDIEFIDLDTVRAKDSGLSMVSLKDLFPTMKKTYGVEIEEPDKHNQTIYKKYVHIGDNASCPVSSNLDVKKTTTTLIQRSTFPLDSAYSVEPPKVNSHSKEIYATYIKHGKNGGDQPSNRDMSIYQQYLWNKYM